MASPPLCELRLLHVNGIAKALAPLLKVCQTCTLRLSPAGATAVQIDSCVAYICELSSTAVSGLPEKPLSVTLPSATWSKFITEANAAHEAVLLVFEDAARLVMRSGKDKLSHSLESPMMANESGDDMEADIRDSMMEMKTTFTCKVKEGVAVKTDGFQDFMYVRLTPGEGCLAVEGVEPTGGLSAVRRRIVCDSHVPAPVSVELSSRFFQNAMMPADNMVIRGFGEEGQTLMVKVIGSFSAVQKRKAGKDAPSASHVTTIIIAPRSPDE